MRAFQMHPVKLFFQWIVKSKYVDTMAHMRASKPQKDRASTLPRETSKSSETEIGAASRSIHVNQLPRETELSFI